MLYHSIGTCWVKLYIRDSLSHKKRCFGQWRQHLVVPLLWVQKCFHPRMDWEQWDGEIKARLVAQGVYTKPGALIFNAGYSP